MAAIYTFFRENQELNHQSAIENPIFRFDIAMFL